MPVKSFIYVRVCLLLLIIQSGTAFVLNCQNMNPIACKKEFSKFYKDEIKATFSKFGKEGYEKLIEMYNNILAHLPQDSKFREPMIKKRDEFIVAAKSFDQGHENVKALVSLLAGKVALSTYIQNIEADPKSTNEFLTLFMINMEMFQSFYFESANKIQDHLITIWSQFYANLRKGDRDTYPEYKSINQIFKDLQTESASGKINFLVIIKHLNTVVQSRYLKRIVDEHETWFGYESIQK